jgi:hypothetical protein
MQFRIKFIHLVFLSIGALSAFSLSAFAQSSPSICHHASETPSKPDSLSNNTDTNSQNPSDDVVRQADLFQVKELIELQAQRAVVSNYTVQFSGYGIANVVSREDKNPAFSFSSSSFGLNLGGKLREDNVEDGDLSYAAGLYYSPATSFTILDLYLKWEILSIKSGLNPTFIVNTTFGQFLTPFGSENLAAEDKKPTIKSAQFLGKYGISRDVGVSVDAGIFNEQDPYTSLLIPHIALTAGIFNGNGWSKATGDTSKQKDVLLKAIFTPSADYFSPLYSLKFGASVLLSNFDFIGGTPHDSRQIYDFQAEYLKKPFLFTLEYVRGKTLSWSQATNAESYVATIFYTADALPDFQPLIRYDKFNPNWSGTTVPAGVTAATINNYYSQSVYTIGFNYFFYQVAPLFKRSYEIAKTERVIKLQLNYNYYVNDAPRLVRKKTGEIYAQIVFSF